MAIVSKPFFAVKCDNCGKHSGKGSRYEFWRDIESADISSQFENYIKLGDKHYCDDCCDDNLIIKKINRK